ncbi:RelA/SpoT domain-containing protein [Mycobacteroides abscessus subsp. bolletii]|uniref:GTP pyrophosphokinase n=1 Tax=Mycobacteroides abscessus TaxID=36809 RepID=UPI0009A6E45A|nr:hypothetical protein [Mycobacteroides abscessus]SKG85812.1 RelA/SpoT domain-containing protein [Mycobacteroides abscessus subsp. bolletii]SKH44769.1 RelA/SpoT domain-containing protein [Mycobacteroides abscessus subsp. bolletii]
MTTPPSGPVSGSPPPAADPVIEESSTFDFEAHQASAEDEYRRIRGTYQDFAKTIRDIIERSLKHDNVMVHSIESRAKEIDSFGKKAASPNPEDPEQPKYSNPLRQITDLAAARVITFFLSSLKQVDRVIKDQFDIVERNDRGGEKSGEARLGYQSIHYLVKIKDNRLQLPEYVRFRGLIAELQVRTILQHAWAEIEHEIQYKAVDVLPKEIRRRFLALAGMLEIGDREFQALEDAHRQLLEDARKRIASGDLDVELTPDSLKTLLDQKLGEDGRMRDWSYSFATRILKQFGFTTIKQVDHAIRGYNDDKISRLIHGGRMGQITRFEDVLLASMGHTYRDNHPWSGKESMWFEELCDSKLQRLEKGGISIGNYDPRIET